MEIRVLNEKIDQEHIISALRSAGMALSAAQYKRQRWSHDTQQPIKAQGVNRFTGAEKMTCRQVNVCQRHRPITARAAAEVTGPHDTTFKGAAHVFTCHRTRTTVWVLPGVLISAGLQA